MYNLYFVFLYKRDENMGQRSKQPVNYTKEDLVNLHFENQHAN